MLTWRLRRCANYHQTKDDGALFSGAKTKLSEDRDRTANFIIETIREEERPG